MSRSRARFLISVGALSITLAILAAASCGGEQGGSTKTATNVPLATEPTSAPGADERVTLRGNLTLDGTPLNAEFLGVRVLHDGLAAACQHTIPAVVQGRYEILVDSNTEVRGCGVPGAELLLWTFVNGAYFSSSQTLPWPGSGATVTFDATFSSGSPEGASEPVTEFKGHLFDREGRPLPSGTVVEAYVGDVRCGLTSLRHGDEVERFYTLIVAGPEAISDCAEGATLTFRLNGELAVETAVNDLGRGSQAHELNLTGQ
ncbi:MAG: hypothetical protein WBD55_12925 [Dehalococcoidia bacterium]